MLMVNENGTPLNVIFFDSMLIVLIGSEPLTEPFHTNKRAHINVILRKNMAKHIFRYYQSKAKLAFEGFILSIRHIKYDNLTFNFI